MSTEKRPKRRSAVFSSPLKDRAGRFSWIKTICLTLCVAPALCIAAWWVAGRLGGRPIHQAMLDTGFWAVRFLVLCLAVTPARSWFDWSRLIQLRRMLGLTAAFYTFAHVTLYAAEQGFDMGFVLGQMLTVFYLILGTIATLGLFALALTSTDAAIARLGKKWISLHRLIYPIAILSFWHFFLTQKIDIGTALVPAGLTLWLLLWRASAARSRQSLAGLAGLAMGVVVITALGEAGWYALYSGLNPRLVLDANFSFSRWSAAQELTADFALILLLIAMRRLLPFAIVQSR